MLVGGGEGGVKGLRRVQEGTMLWFNLNDWSPTFVISKCRKGLCEVFQHPVFTPHTSYSHLPPKICPFLPMWMESTPTKGFSERPDLLAGVLNKPDQQDTMKIANLTLLFHCPSGAISIPDGKISGRSYILSAHFQGNEYRLIFRLCRQRERESKLW